MCTVSWIHENDGYRLLCNRDEKRTRRQAIEPQAEQRHGVRFLAPIDGERGGTWLSVNEYGLALCLLNGACLSGSAPAHEPMALESRGRIPLELVDAMTARAACERLVRIDLTRFAAFTLVLAEPGLPAAVAEWNGQELAILPQAEPFVPLVSSSYEPESVRTWRQAEFRRCTGLDDFHRSHAGGANAFSPCMHRDDAETVSHTEIRVTEDHVSLLYSAGSPCRGVPAVERCLTRVQ